MTITAADIKLLESERMTDASDGGGRRTSNVIPDGVAGNIFPKVSRLDSVYGRVNLRKAYMHVDTANLDVYAGAHAVILDAADNDKIKVNIFSTGSDFDERSDARDRIESYVIAGPESRMVLYGRQLVGQQAFTAMQRVEDPIPEVGEVFCLSNEPGGEVETQQFVRAEEVLHEVRTFTDTIGDYDRRIVTVKLSTTLRYEFVGQELVSRLSAVTRTALVRTTTVADAARYFGLSPIAQAIAESALEIRVDSIFSNLVPTTQRETAVSNAQIGGAGSTVRASSTPVSINYGRMTLGAGLNDLRLPGAVKKGTLTMQTNGYTGGAAPAYTATYTDQGDGTLDITASSVPGASATVPINYEGVITFERFTTATTDWEVIVSYVPAVERAQPAHQMELPITLATRGTVFSVTLNPLPADGSVFVDYRALGKWYRLRDDGTGAIGGDDPLYGTGVVDPVTGALVVTLGALPDVDSSVVIGWASPVHYTIRAGATSDAESVVHQRIQLGNLPITPGSVSVTYTAGSTEYVATDDTEGVINNNGIVGEVNYVTGAVDLTYSTRLPNMETLVTVDYQQEVPDNPAEPNQASGVAVVVGGASADFATAANVATSTVDMFVRYLTPNFYVNVGEPVTIRVRDDGAGNLISYAATLSASGRTFLHEGGQTLGTIDYATGDVTLSGGLVVRTPVYSFPAAGWSASHEVTFALAAADCNWSVGLTAASTATARSESFSQEDAPFTFDLTPSVASSIVPNSVIFTAFGKGYFDRNGVLYHSIELDGSGTAAGAINYETGEATLTRYVNNTAFGLSVKACLTRFGDFTAVSAAFRTAGSPLRPASTFISVVAMDGETLTATTDQDGVVTGDFARGEVNQQMGLVSIEWGEMVTAAGNESEPWYDPENVVGSEVWKPREIMPDSIRYSAVVLSNLPVNADILGLDPIRLPSDGRVPIFRPGDVVLMHNAKTTALTNPVAAGATYSAGRTDLADLYLVDDEGTKVPTDQYVVDLVAGTVTMSAALDLGSLVQPLHAKHRIEELNLASDVQINGVITLTSPVGRAFDTDTKVSSCLLFGDVQARVTNVFDQVTWTGEWSDSRIGDNATAEYDDANYPIEVLNNGAVTERWRIHFTNSSGAFQVIGENLGVIATGSTVADCAPVNSLTGNPYFVIRADGWGLGWGSGQQLRFNTIGATAPIWMVRTVLPGATLEGDSIDIQARGDVDA